MSASLLSDMESFKAANPNGKLEDFIRWYSPRDWIEEDNAKTGGKQNTNRTYTKRIEKMCTHWSGMQTKKIGKMFIFA